MRYEDALSWLYARQRFGIKQGLENVRELLAALEDPQDSFDAFHVTGTNGKGSVVAFLDAALRAGKHNVGRYTSPHLSTFTERITVGGQEIPRPDLCLLVEQVQPMVAELESRGVKPTFFEAVTAIAFQYFRRRRVQCAVVEVGMGGRWDATNVVRPVATVITNVGLEHTDRLGSTTAAIAAEKAGIIKERVPLVTRAVGDAYDVIRRRAKEVDAPIQFAAPPTMVEESLTTTRARLALAGEEREVRISLLGRHQADNASVAATALASQSKYPVTAETIAKAFEATKWPGRLEPASKAPLVLLDGAHNAPACQVLSGFLERAARPRKIHVLFTALRDKNLPGMVRAVAPVADRWIATTAPNERALPAATVAQAIRAETGKSAAVQDDVVEAIRALHVDAAPEDVLVVAGSLFLVGAARAALLKTPTDPEVPHAIQQ